jgi:shikimate dehydrogenase
MRVVLIGFRGTGKTETGRLLSRLMGLPYYDTDLCVEEMAGKGIHEIFAEDGEDAFRELERSAVAYLPAGDAVISTGGGIILDQGNVSALRRDAVMILLYADEKTLEKRIAGSERPRLTNMPLEEEIHLMMETRRPYYLAAADYSVDTSARNINEVCLYIRRILSEGTISPGMRRESVRFMQESGIDPFDVKEFEEWVLGSSGDQLTRFFGIAGFPCTHSRSPHLFNTLFSGLHHNSYYARFQAGDLGKLMHVVHGLDVRGLSVTIPYKHQVMDFLDFADEHATAIGAANTVLFCEGRAYGFNTDWIGIREPLLDLRGENAVVLGAGGAAAAAAYALRSLEMEVTILNRTVEKAEMLARRFDCAYGPPDAFDGISANVVVNATSLGMHPDTRSPLRRDQLAPGMTVFDLVYTPPDTPLIRMARNAGCQTIRGTEMFARQAAAQFWHFTGIRPPLEEIRRILQ